MLELPFKEDATLAKNIRPCSFLNLDVIFIFSVCINHIIS